MSVDDVKLDFVIEHGESKITHVGDVGRLLGSLRE